LSFQVSRMGHVNSREEVLEAFTVFDAGRKGYLTRAELQRVLQDLGEMISPQEAQAMLQTIASTDGNIHYPQVVQSWFAYDR
jgi:Ca2+-binding EF-hand superfamily protein